MSNRNTMKRNDGMKGIPRGRQAPQSHTPQPFQRNAPQQNQPQQQRRPVNQQQYRAQGYGQQIGGGQTANQQVNLSSDEESGGAKRKQFRNNNNDNELSEDELEKMLESSKKPKIAAPESSESSDEDLTKNQNVDIIASALESSGKNGKGKKMDKNKEGKGASEATGVPPQPQTQPPQQTTPSAEDPNAPPDAGEATVYKLSTGDTSNGGNGEEFFVELKAYANLRQERDRILTEFNDAKGSGKLGTSATDAFLDTIESALLLDIGGEYSISMNRTREIVSQRQGHRVIQELAKKILSQDEDKNSARVDAGWMKSMSQKIKELEESKQHLHDMNNVLKQANADLTIESRRKVDNAINEAKQHVSVEKNNMERSLNNRIQELERNNMQIQDMNQNLEKANADLIIQSTSKQEDLKQALNDARKNGGGDKNQMRNLTRKVQELENYNRQLQELNASVKQANADLTNESREKLEIALEEVKKANAAEKALKMEKRNFIKELDNSKKVTDSLNKQLNDHKHRNSAQEEKMKELEEQAKQASEENETTKNLRESYQGLYRSNQSRLAEISQLKIVIDRISRENTMWATEIKEFRGKPICKIPEHAGRDSCFIKIRDSFLDNNNIDQGSKKSLSDGAVTDLIMDVLKEHVGMKRHYASEIMNSVDKLRKLGRKVHEKDQESAAYEKLAAQKDNAVSMLNKKLLSTIGDMKSKAENFDSINKKCQLWSDRANRTMKEVEMLKKLIEPEKQKSQKLDEMVRKSKQESEVLKNKLISAVKEIDNYKELKTKAATQFSNMKEDFKTLQKDAVQLKNNLSKAVEKIKDLQGNQIGNRDSKIGELNKEANDMKKETDQLKKDKADLLKKIKWAREHVTALDSKHNQLEEEVNKGKNLNTEIHWERTKMEEDLRKAQETVVRLEEQIVTVQNNAGSSNNSNEKVLRELLSKKDEELQKTKGETANFQNLMKKDLEKIKQMSLAHTNNKERDSKKLDDSKKEVDELKKSNEEFKVQVQILEGYNRQLRQNKNSAAPPPNLPTLSNQGAASSNSGKRTAAAKNLFNKEKGKEASKEKSKEASSSLRLKQEREPMNDEDSDTPVSPPKSTQPPQILSSGEGTMEEQGEESWANIQLPWQ